MPPPWNGGGFGFRNIRIYIHFCKDPDIKRIYDREREREVDRIRYLIEKNRNRLTAVEDPQAVAMVIHNAVENVAHTARFMGTDIASERLVDGLTDMISGFFLGSDES